FSVVTAWGCVLNIAGLYLLCRWTARLTPGHACLATFLAAVGCNSLGFSANHGFLCQVYGTATLAVFIAFLSRMARAPSWRRGHAILLGSTAAMMVSCYPELLPFLVLVGLVWVTVSVRGAARAGRLPAFLGFVAAILAIALAVANIEVLRAWNFLNN